MQNARNKRRKKNMKKNHFSIKLFSVVRCIQRHSVLVFDLSVIYFYQKKTKSIRQFRRINVVCLFIQSSQLLWWLTGLSRYTHIANTERYIQIDRVDRENGRMKRSIFIGMRLKAFVYINTLKKGKQFLTFILFRYTFLSLCRLSIYLHLYLFAALHIIFSFF